jgi:Trk K+ transport system NAD-binding subunit
MFSRLKSWVLFRLERTMMRGPLSRFAAILCLVVMIAVGGGVLIRLLVPGFESTADAVWWAFLRLTDPGYLGDDEGTAKRSISTVLILFNYILFTGTLIAIIVQWLNQTMERLEQGTTPITLDQHFVVLGWTSRTTTMLQEILVSKGRVDRFLRQRGIRNLHVAILAEGGDAALMQEIRVQLGEHWKAGKVILRSGSPLDLDDLARVDFNHAAAILIPAADSGGNSARDADTRTVKTLMTLGAELQEDFSQDSPLIVAELQDPRHTAMLRSLYAGPMEVIAGDEIIAQLMVQTIRYPGLSHVYAELLTDVGSSQIYVREETGLVGVSVQQLSNAFSEAVLLGVVRPHGNGFQALLNPPNDLCLEADDRIVVLASSYLHAAPPQSIDAAKELTERPAPEPELRDQRRVLLLGWNHRIPLLLNELASHTRESFLIDIVSEVSASKRTKRLAAEGPVYEQIQIRQLEFDFTVPAYLDDVDLAGYDNVILLSSERLKPGSESDARTILGYLLLRDLTKTGAQAPSVLVELTDPDNARLFRERSAEIIVSPVIVSHMLARVTLRRELRVVFDELFGSGGCDIFFRRMTDFNLSGGQYAFADLQRAADARGEIAIGVRWAGRQHMPNGGVELNPARAQRLDVGENDELIVLSNPA